jgi:hypothetical protein
MTTTDIVDPFSPAARRERVVDWQAPGPAAKVAADMPGLEAMCAAALGAVGTIQAEGKVVKLGRQTSYAEGFVRDGAGNLAVHATATFSMIGGAGAK